MTGLIMSLVKPPSRRIKKEKENKEGIEILEKELERVEIHPNGGLDSKFW